MSEETKNTAQEEETTDTPVTEETVENEPEVVENGEAETEEIPVEDGDEEASQDDKKDSKSKTSFFGKKKKEKDKFVTNQSRVTYARDKTNQIYYEQKQIFKDIIRGLHLHSLNLLRTKKRTETITSTLLEYTKRYVVWTR